MNITITDNPPYKPTSTTNIKDVQNFQQNYYDWNEEDYQKNLKRRQKEHLDKVNNNKFDYVPFQPCLHDNCSECVGTGVKLDGSICIHMLSCPCPKCTPQY